MTAIGAQAAIIPMGTNCQILTTSIVAPRPIPKIRMLIANVISSVAAYYGFG